MNKYEEDVCPYCRSSSSLDYSQREFQDNEVWQDIHCYSCGGNFRQVYGYTGTVLLDVKGEEHYE